MLLSSEGSLCYIIPNSILVNDSYLKIREYIIDRVDKIIKLPDTVFDVATVETIILHLHNGNNKKQIQGAYFKKDDKINFSDLTFCSFERSKWKSDPSKRFNIFLNENISNLLDKISANTNELGEYVYTSLGITPYDKYKGHDTATIQGRKFHSDKPLDSTYVPLISGANIHPFYVSDDISEYLKYGEWLGAPREPRFFESPKIIVRQILSGESQRIIAAYSDKPYYFTQIGFSLISKTNNTNELKYLTCILNSSLMSFYHRYTFLDLEKVVFQKILIANAKKLPIKKCTELHPFLDFFIDIEHINFKRLDMLVYNLYDLTYDEVLIVDPNPPFTREEYETQA